MISSKLKLKVFLKGCFVEMVRVKRMTAICLSMIGHLYGTITTVGGAVSELDSGSSCPGSSPGQGHCVVFLGKTRLSQHLSPPRCING